MKVIHSENGVYTLSFDKGEEVISSLLEFLKENGIQAGHLSGLGAVSNLVIAYYDTEIKDYKREPFNENLEILSLVGNIGVKKEKELVVHMHGVFGRSDFSTLGGHIMEMTISGAGEIHLMAFSGTINRAYDEDTGLTLMCEVE